MRISTLAIAAFVLFVVSLPLYAETTHAKARIEKISTRQGVYVPTWVISPKQVHAYVIYIQRAQLL